MRTHNICFHGEIRTKFSWCPLLSGPYLDDHMLGWVFAGPICIKHPFYMKRHPKCCKIMRKQCVIRKHAEKNNMLMTSYYSIQGTLQMFSLLCLCSIFLDCHKLSGNTVFTISNQPDRHEQTVYTKIRCRRMWHLIRVYTVCHLSSSFWHINWVRLRVDFEKLTLAMLKKLRCPTHF